MSLDEPRPSDDDIRRAFVAAVGAAAPLIHKKLNDPEILLGPIRRGDEGPSA